MRSLKEFGRNPIVKGWISRPVGTVMQEQPGIEENFTRFWEEDQEVRE